MSKCKHHNSPEQLYKFIEAIIDGVQHIDNKDIEIVDSNTDVVKNKDGTFTVEFQKWVDTPELGQRYFTVFDGSRASRHATPLGELKTILHISVKQEFKEFE